MSPKKYTNNPKKEKNGGDNEILGIVLVIISAFLLLCIVVRPILWSISEAIYNVVIGLMGFSAYPVFLCTLILGIVLIQDRKMSLPPKYAACIGTMAAALFLILQLATSHSLLNAGFSSYVSGVYHSLTAGGLLFGIVAYGIQALITPVASYVVYSLVIAGAGAIMLLPFFTGKKSLKRKNRPPEKTNSGPKSFVKGIAPAQTVKSIPDKTLYVDKIIPVHNNFESESGSFGEPTRRRISSFTTDNPQPLSFDAAPAGEPREDEEKKNQARQILFGDQQKYMADLAARSSAEPDKPKIDFSAEQSSYLAGYTLPPVTSSAPDIRDRTLPDTPKKPPKKLHIADIPELQEIPSPPPKDFSDQIVGGTIINGDEFARQYAEEHAPVGESPSAVETRIEDGFNLRKIEPVSVKPRPQPETPQEEERSPITNGDYFAEPAVAPFPPRKSPEEGGPKPNSVPSTVRSEAADADTAEARFERLFSEEKEKAASSGDAPEFPAVPEPTQDAGSFADKRNDEENTVDFDVPTEENPVPEEYESAFRYQNEVVDLSEKPNFDGEDHTGYYEPVADEGSARARGVSEPRPEPAAPPVLRSANQIRIDDYVVSSAQVEVKPKKKKHVHYNPPPIDLLINAESSAPEDFNAACEEKARLLEETLKGLKLPATVIAITRGPAVTRYELEMPPGIPVKRIEQYSTDIEYYLASNGRIRIETPIPGKRAVGIEVPNEKIDIVGLRDIINSKEFQNSSSPLTLALGKDIAGTNIICNLDKMPHLLIAGATGSGKSACLNSIIISILYKASPEDVRLILIDPKHVEFTIYKNLPHLLTEDIITDAQQAINALKWARGEMERRYLLFGKYVVRNLQEFNKCDAVKDGTESKIPYIVLIVDELAELMMSNNRKELEDKIMSMAQKARAAGIHLILATQRPSVDVITGTIKANLPSRIAFSVKSIIDSRTILDQSGAETLLGRGDMLYAPLGFDDPRRVQGAFVTNEEVATVAGYVRDNNPTDFDEEIKRAIDVKEEAPEGESEEEDKEFDDIMPDVLKCVIESGSASTSMIQRRFSVGYARASRIIDQMELHKFIGPLEGSKPRAVYISREQYRELFGQEI